MTHEADAAARTARLLGTVARRVGASLSLDATLEAIAQAGSDALGFRAVVVNLLGSDDELHVVAVAGSDELRLGLMGKHSPRKAWQAILATAREWGELRFLPHGSCIPAAAMSMEFFVPDIEEPTSGEVDRWHPEDALFAPLTASDGQLLGVLSVDEPADGLLPSPVQCAVLEALAVHAALAIEHARQHRDLQESEELLQRMFDESPVGKALFGPDGRFIRVNRAFCDFLGRAPEEFPGRRIVDFAHPEERESTLAMSRQVREQERPLVQVVKRYLHADGHELWGRVRLTRIGEGDAVSVLAAVEDITEARAVDEQLRHHALHDSLTGLPNRTLLFDRLEQAVARSHRDGTQVGVVVVDIDHFKLVNDSYGHPAGDQMLVAVADALREGLRSSDTAGRLGGDEFVVLCEGVTGPAEVAAIAERLRAAVRIPVRAGDGTLLPSASLGCTISTPMSTADQLVAEADLALYRAKAAGRGRFELYDDEMRQSSLAQLELRAELAVAVEEQQFRLHYQPIVDLDTATTIGFEALLRWQHPTRGLLLPADFLDVITDGDLDVPVTQWVLQQACHDIVRLSRQTGEQPFVSVNLSARQLSRVGLIDDVCAALAGSRLPAKRLWLEITEEHLIDRGHRPALDQLRDLGCRIVLDDFGTGYSGLTYLQQLPVSVLKIDRAFVAQVGTDRISAGITAAVTDLAEVLGVQVVAEGVETEEQAELLHGMGIGLAQGYFFGRPAPLGDEIPVPAALTLRGAVSRLS